MSRTDQLSGKEMWRISADYAFRGCDPEHNGGRPCAG
ncbi:MAG: hypothetical protein JWN52_7571 [Actinomycetia bacterium]|jgi:hypothetical protein|nr:hypothetical protein [Actinomycetes bacterium]